MHKSQTFHHSIPRNQRVSETNMFRNQIKILLILVIKLILLETRVFQIKQSQHQFISNKHAGGPIDQVHNQYTCR
jgi:hypothetical protein